MKIEMHAPCEVELDSEEAFALTFVLDIWITGLWSRASFAAERVKENLLEQGKLRITCDIEREAVRAIASGLANIGGLRSR
jgi:hypothetical protein